MRWLCLSLPRLPLEACESPAEGCVAITEQHRQRRWLIACNDACAAAGVHPGLEATTALALLPTLQLRPRTARRELAALKALALWAGQFSGHVSFDAERQLLWLEIASSLRYFGGLAPLRERVERGLDELGYRGDLGIAPTPEAAALLARPQGPAPIATIEELRSRLAPLPLAWLALSAASIDALQQTGLRRIGEVLALPRASVARRLGPAATRYLAQLLGELPQPLNAYQPPARYQRRFEFFGAIETTEGLLFPLKRIFGELEGFLRARDTAVQQLELRFEHEHHPPTRLPLRTTRPLRDAAKLLALLRERLERSTFADAVIAVQVAAARFVAPGDSQLDLLDPARNRGEAWADLLDKLRARLGHDAVHYLALCDDHRPEQAWCLQDTPPPSAAPVSAARPLWLLPPRALPRPPLLAGRPERIEAGWWQGRDVARDYYRVEQPDGARLWLYRDLADDRWYLQGLWG